MSRIGSYGSSQMYLSRLMAIQNRITQEQIQVATEKKSVNYAGIAADSNRLINMENEKNRAQSYIDSNAMASTRLTAASVSMDAIEATMKNFKKQLDTFAQQGVSDEQSVEQLQKFAYQAMVDMRSYLGANVDGQYIFSGGRVSDQPVTLPANSLDQFQQRFDGDVVTYPTTRAASLTDIHLTAENTGALSFNTATGTIAAATDAFDTLQPGARLTLGGVVPETTFTVQGVDPATNQIKVSRMTSESAPEAVITYKNANGETVPMSPASLTFSPQGDTITASTVGSLSDLTVGQVFHVTGSNGNNGSYEVLSNNGTDITVRSTKLDFVQPTTTENTATIGGVPAGTYGSLSFSANSSGQLVISAANGGSLPAPAFAAGTTFTVAGATASGNNGTYTVVANSGGTSLTVTRVTGGTYTMPTTAEATLSADSWYEGDTIQIQQRIDTNRIIDLGVYASDPAFEKAFRAMGLIAQGAYGTAGGLENNLERVNQARFLMTDAINRDSSGLGPFGQEQAGDIEQLQTQVGVSASIIATKNDLHKKYAGFLDTRVSTMENVDMTEAITRLMDDQTALQASYQALASVRGLSLLNYLN